MSEQDIDEELKERFRELRAERASRIPDFGATMVRAEATQASRPTLTTVHGSATHTRRRWVLAGAWGSLAAAAAAAGLLLVERGPSPEEEFAQLVAAYSTDVSGGAWRSPTSSLLDVPGMELMRSVPSIGATVPSYDAPTNEPAPSSGPREDA